MLIMFCLVSIRIKKHFVDLVVSGNEKLDLYNVIA